MRVLDVWVASFINQWLQVAYNNEIEFNPKQTQGRVHCLFHSRGLKWVWFYSGHGGQEKHVFYKSQYKTHHQAIQNYKCDFASEWSRLKCQRVAHGGG